MTVKKRGGKEGKAKLKGKSEKESKNTQINIQK
jgi:hypothetical protein